MTEKVEEGVSLRIYEVIDVVQGIREFCSNANLQLDARTRFKLLRIKQELMKPLEAFEEARRGVCEQYCEKEKDGSPKIEGNSYVFSKKARKKVVEEVNVLRDETVELSILLSESDFTIKEGDERVPIVMDGEAGSALEAMSPILKFS